MDKRQGFTLVELVVVVMILGILAAVAAPKLLGTSGTATDNGLRQTLGVVRDAIERYTAQNGSPPPGTDLAVELKEYLRQFPASPVGTKDATVKVGTADPLAADGTTAWMYNADTGEFIANSSSLDSGGSIKYEEY